MADPKDTAAGGQCSALSHAVNRTIGLGIDLVGVTVKDAPQILERVLKDPKVAKALAEALKKAGQDLMAEQSRGQALTLDQSLSKLGSAAGGVLSKPSEQEVRRQREFQRLETSLRELSCAFESSPVGVFVNENKTLLIIVGSVAAIAGGVAMYYTKAGDAPAQALGLLPKLDIVKIGGVTLSASNINFTPSERKVSGTFGAQGKWGAVAASLELSATFANDSLQSAESRGRLTLTLDPRMTMHVAGSVRWSRGELSPQESTTLSGEVGLSRRISTRSNLTLRLHGQFVDGATGATGTAGLSGGWELGQPFGKDTRLRLDVDGSMSGRLSPSRLPDIPAPGQQQSPAAPARQMMLRLQLEW